MVKPSVGIFWLIDGVLIGAGCPLDCAVPYGDRLTYDEGHAERWTILREMGSKRLLELGLPLNLLDSEYDDHPRGRVVKEPELFVVYADRRLQKPKHLANIRTRFGLEHSPVAVRGDAHYRARASELRC